MLQGARESVFTTKADHSFFTEPVSCQVSNAVGKTNVSILVDVHCESLSSHLVHHSLQSAVRGIKHTIVVFLFPLSSFSPLVLLHYYSSTTKEEPLSLSVSVSPVGPILLVEPQPKTVDVDSDVTLNCKWAGNPPLTLTWFKKGSNMVRSCEPTLSSVLVFTLFLQFTLSSSVFTKAACHSGPTSCLCLSSLLPCHFSQFHFFFCFIFFFILRWDYI